MVQRYDIERKNWHRYRKATPHRPRELERKFKRRVRVYEKKPPLVPGFMYRVSVAVNAPVSFKYDPKEIPERTVPVKRKYFGFLFQAWSLKKGELDIRWARGECIRWTGEALKKLSLGLFGWPRSGYSPEEWWLSYTVGSEFEVKVPFVKGLPGTWLFQIESEDGTVAGSRSGRL